MLEIRAGTGGDEAALFAAELFRIQPATPKRQGWKIELMSPARADKGGLKEVIARSRARASTAS